MQTYYVDSDDDNFGTTETIEACSMPPLHTDNDNDCDDTNASINPDASEICDEIDNNCNDQIDEGVTSTFYEDGDDDGFGGDNSVESCSAPGGYVDNSDDCNDANASCSPDGTETCDGILDEDCDGTVDEGCGCTDGDTQACGNGQGVCEGASQTCEGGTWGDCSIVPEDEICDELDNDCDGETDENVENIYFRDADDDGFGDLNEHVDACSAPSGYVSNFDDCDDTNPDTNPDAVEVCDEIDNDCDGDIDENVLSRFYGDRDHDGFGQPRMYTDACSAPSGYVDNRDDCDDADRDINPDATEICDEIDNNCDGRIDEGVELRFYHDRDRDEFGNPNVMEYACEAPSEYVDNGDDCNDRDRHINPDALEICDEIDNNCDGRIDEGVTTTYYLDLDRDNYGGSTNQEACEAPSGYVERGGDCNDANHRIFPGANERCDDLDNDCDELVDEGLGLYQTYPDLDRDRFGDRSVFPTLHCLNDEHLRDHSDCNDLNSDINPDAEEVCDEIDNNCNDQIDEGVTTTYYQDLDRDRFGAGIGREECTAPSGWIDNDEDCNDANPAINPDAREVCDEIDHNCDGDPTGGLLQYRNAYPDVDADGFGDNSVPSIAHCLGEHWTSDHTDCYDEDPMINPDAEEICDARDNNCNNTIDEDPDADQYCAARPNIRNEALCSGGECDEFVCTRNYDDCNGLDADGCEADLQTDRLNCGDCGNICRPRERCFLGNCQ